MSLTVYSESQLHVLSPQALNEYQSALTRTLMCMAPADREQYLHIFEDIETVRTYRLTWSYRRTAFIAYIGDALMSDERLQRLHSQTAQYLAKIEEVCKVFTDSDDQAALLVDKPEYLDKEVLIKAEIERRKSMKQ